MVKVGFYNNASDFLPALAKTWLKEKPCQFDYYYFIDHS